MSPLMSAFGPARLRRNLQLFALCRRIADYPSPDRVPGRLLAALGVPPRG